MLGSYSGESIQFISKLIHWDFQRNSWVLQEKWKGLPVGIAGSRHMGWGFNSTENAYITPIVNNPDGSKSGGDFFTAAQANSGNISNTQLFTKPLFRKEVLSWKPFMDSVLSFDNIIKTIYGELLAYALPALTTATGGWEGEIVEKKRLDFVSIDMNAIKNDNTWPRNKKEWMHSDIKDVALPYTYPVIESLAIKGALK